MTLRLTLAVSSNATLDAAAPTMWWTWLVYSKPVEETRLWEAPTDHGWALMSDVGTCRAGVPEALIQWRRARGEPRPDPMF